MSIEIIDGVFIVICLTMLASLYQQHKKVEPLIGAISNLEKRVNDLHHNQIELP